MKITIKSGKRGWIVGVDDGRSVRAATQLCFEEMLGVVIALTTGHQAGSEYGLRCLNWLRTKEQNAADISRKRLREARAYGQDFGVPS